MTGSAAGDMDEPGSGIDSLLRRRAVGAAHGPVSAQVAGPQVVTPSWLSCSRVLRESRAGPLKGVASRRRLA